MQLFPVLLALASSFSLASANYASDCDPLTDSCSADPALGTSIYLDFSEETDYFTPLYNSDLITYSKDGLKEEWQTHGQSPSLRSNFYILYGKIEISAKTALGTGLVSNLFLQSDDGDEIDFEWVSTYKTQVQSNYFGKGVTGSYDRGKTHDLSFDTTADYHVYTIEWTESAITWSVDGAVQRTLEKSSVSTSGAYDYPVAPSRVFLGVWAAGDSTDSGTVEWAGGATSTDGAPFYNYVKYIKISDYSTGTEYKYNDKTGESFSATDGSVNGRANADFAGTVAAADGFSGASSSTAATASSTSAPASDAVQSTSSTSYTFDNTTSSSTSAIVSTTPVVAAVSTSDIAAEAGSSSSEVAIQSSGVYEDDFVTSTEEDSIIVASQTTVIDGVTSGVSYGVVTTNGEVQTYTTAFVPLTSTQTKYHYVTRRKHSNGSNSSGDYAGVVFQGNGNSISKNMGLTVLGLISLIFGMIAL